MSNAARRRLRRRAAACLALALPGASCERPNDVAATAAPVEPSSTRRLSTPTAFDLAPTTGGAVLAWSAPGSGSVQVLGFDRDGEPAAGERPGLAIGSVGPGVADLALASTEAGLALAWNEEAPVEARLRAAWLESDGPVRTFELGAAFRGDGASRGALALVARDGSALLLSRGLATPCSDSGEQACAAFRFFEIRPDQARATGLSLTVPSPCTTNSALLVSAQRSATGGAGPFEYAICAGSPATSVLTVFSIQPSPAYAAAEEALAGCAPLGAGRFGGEATFVALCGAQRRSVSVPIEGGALVARNLDERGLLCSAGGAVLRFGPGWLRPSEPLGRLELLLSDDLAPAGARAVWTGRALLVALARDGRLSLARYACRGSQLVELDVLRDAGD